MQAVLASALEGHASRMFVANPATPPHTSAKDPSVATVDLQVTFADAIVDERPPYLPLLFRVDEEVRWADGLSYRASCVELPRPAITAQGQICVHFAWGPQSVGR